MGRLRWLTAGESHGRRWASRRGRAGGPRRCPRTSSPSTSPGASAATAAARARRSSTTGPRSSPASATALTLGSPILLLVANRDWENWTRSCRSRGSSDDEAAELAAAAEGGNKRATPVTRVRPGHADLAGALKYGFNDVRNVLERASARETAARVAAGGVARAILARARRRGLVVHRRGRRRRASIPARATRSREEADESPLRCPDPDAEAAMIARIDEARSNGDTVGGVFEVVAHGLPIGLGSYVHWDRRLDAALAAAVMSINIVKGVEFGLGFEQTRRFGSAVHDVIEGRGEGGRWIHRSNNAGGPDRRRDERRAARRPRRGQADLDARPAAALGRPLTGEAVDKAHYERSRHQRRPGGRRRRRGDGDADPRRRDARQVRRRHDRRRRDASTDTSSGSRAARRRRSPRATRRAAAADRRVGPAVDEAGSGGDD